MKSILSEKKTAMEEDKQFLALSSAQREYYDE